MLVAFGGMVEYYVEKDLDVVAMKFFHQSLELVDLHAELAGGGIAGFGRKEAERAIAPVITDKLPPGLWVLAAVLELVELVDRQQLDAVDAQFLEVRNFLADAREDARKAHAGGLMLGEAADVHLVDNEVLQRDFQRTVVIPVEIVIDEARPVLVDVVPVRRLPPDIAPANGLGIRVH